MTRFSAVQNDPPLAPDQLAALHAEKSKLQTQISELAATIGRLLALANEEATLLATIDDIGRREIEGMTEWASRGCVGDPPSPLTSERTAAAKHLAVARLQIESSSTVRAEIEARQAEASAALAEIERKIDAVILDALENEFHAAREKFASALAAVRLLAADVFGVRAAILSEAETLKMRGRITDATAIYHRVESLGRQSIDVDASPLVGEVNRATEAASARALAMKAGVRK